VRPTAIAGADKQNPPAALKVQLLETFILLKEKTELVRRQVLALEDETGVVVAMCGNSTTLSPKLRGASDASWKALPRIGKSDDCCPQCQLLLQPFPRTTNALLICTHCGFVAKPLRARRERPTLTR